MSGQSNEKSLAGRRALVTGAGSDGIGLAIAVGFARAGADVAIHSLAHDEAAEAALDAVRREGRKALLLTADFSDPAAARGTVHEAELALGGLDILVNNAATTLRKPALETSDDEFLHILQVNLIAQFACAQEAARLMIDKGVKDGRIVMVTSVNQALAVPDQIAYCASKGGVMQMAKVLALELAGTGITVNMIAPGTVVTDLNRHLLADPAFHERRIGPVPMRRLGQPSDIAEAAIYLAGSGSSYVTGSTIVIDGGLSLQ
ncbi:SDR family NAD(P)-dependent oxidoreductase [Jannaschia sp. LMIT008]|uniref:SDR family NAD(P)-dependent oxidoreductase n=1 Tax=Jannaschia maritima TaxID=3032585 RepID=UPI00281133F2|nr:SDR family oxidoreductase [Jannaschia sp. LMIT008]